ncbi:MAG TPA: T9SS type A sorting domain-containing protein [Bacteroidetes bacterium]|nr:T9SS type A sorting domain-containing protein [Bacteroidota bacterium]
MKPILVYLNKHFKKNIPLAGTLLFLFFIPFEILSQNTRHCHASEQRQLFLENNIFAAHQIREQEATINNWINNNRNSVNNRSVVEIPIVVHIVWNSPEENISDEQILSQIEILNTDYRAQNIEIPNIPSVFQPFVADIEIEFCLAKVDPDGNATTGITRSFTNNSSGIGGTSSIHFSNQGGHDAWDPEHYLNIWVAKFSGSIGGIGTFPGMAPPGEDGVQVNYLQFGNINLDPPYNLGRTLTHEIGHYLNLEHPWGPSVSDCCGDDFVEDTPEACETYLGECPTHPVASCSEPDMFMDYMFYSDDACLAMFTEGQKMRMLATLNTLRQGLLEGDKCTPVAVEEVQNKPELHILQNPVFDNIRFEIIDNKNSKWEVALYAPSGQIIFNKKNIASGFFEIQMRDIPAGLYFIKIKNGRNLVVEKILIYK